MPSTHFTQTDPGVDFMNETDYPATKPTQYNQSLLSGTCKKWQWKHYFHAVFKN